MKQLTTCAFFLSVITIIAGNNPVPFTNNNDVFGTRCFIENRGQFDGEIDPGKKVLFALDNGPEKIYFTRQGIIYKLVTQEAFDEKAEEALESGSKAELQTNTYFVNAEWENSNPSAEVLSADQQSHYFTYGPSRFNSRTFKKITYKNIYDHIDIEYTIPADKATGIKYNVLVHPGARPEQVSLFYSGDISKLKRLKSGDIIIKTPGDDITEHAPVSYYADGGSVTSGFELENNRITFGFPDGYNNTKELVIDPWVTTITSLTTNNYAYDVDYDYFGNTYIYGGYNPFKVAQYNSAGVLSWTFGGNIGTTVPPWSTSPITSQASNFAVNKYNSKTYIGQGFVYNGNRVVRLDASGNYDNFINTSNSNFQEVWDMGFHCVNGAVFVLGGGTSSNISAVTLNDTTAALTLSTFQPTNTMIAQDVVAHAIDENGKIFVIYAGGNMSNKMCLVNNTFNGNIWTVPSTFTVFSEQGNKSQYQWSGSLSSNGFNCLAVNSNYLFYYDGLNLAAYDKATGALYASTTVSGVTLKRQGGIAVDDCNNIYIGGNGSVLCYSLSGTTFNALTSMSLAVSSSTAYVYDIKLDKQNKILYVAGSGFVGTYSPAYTLGCPTASSSCFGAQQVDQIICAGKTITVNVPNASNLGNPTFSLEPGAMSNSTGTFVLTPSVTTNYTAYITGTNPGNVVVTHSTIAHVTVNPQPQTAPTSTQTTCTSTANAINLGLSFIPTGSTPVYTVNWSTLPAGITSNTQTSASGGIVPGVYSATVMTSNGCYSVADFTIDPLPEPAVFTRQPAANYVLNCSTPSITVNYLPATYNYTTYNGSSAPIYGNSAVFTSTNSPATWTVYAEHPVSLCTSAQTFVVTQNTVMPLATISPSYQSITCSLTSITTVTATANPTVNIKHSWMSPLGGSLDDASATSVFLPGAPGTYTHCLENLVNGCKTCDNFTVFSNDGFPTFSVTSPQSFTLGCASRSVANISILNAQTTPTGGAVSYTLLGPPTSTNYVPGGVSTFTVNVPGTWTVITRDNVSLCDTKVQVTVTQNTFAPDITVNYPYSLLTCRDPSVVLQAVTTPTNVAYNWAFLGTPGNLASSSFTVSANFSSPTKTVVGNYTISITNNDNSCIAYSVVPIYQNLFPPIAVINGISEITCVTTTIQLSNGSSTGIPPQFNPSQPIMGYLWSGPSPQLPLQASSSYIAYLPGTYTLVVRDENNGCFSETTKFIKDARDYPLVNKPAPKPFVLDCGAAAVTITPNLVTTGKDYTFEWLSPPGGPGQVTTAVLTTTTPGEYWVKVTNKANGCASDGVLYVVGDTLRASISSDVSEGFAPLKVKFINESHSAVPGSSMTTLWTFGNGTTQTTTLSTISPEIVFTQPGTYTVVAYIRKGECLDSASKVITVEFPSSLEVPNIFTPNGDGVNDIFFLKATGLKDIYMVIFDRWGHKVYEVNSATGNVAWNGKNQKGTDVAAGVYYYILQTKGADGATNDLKGNITLER